MSEKLIHFDFTPRYFATDSHSTNSMHQNVAASVLAEVFGRTKLFWFSVFSSNRDGFKIICTAAQFGNFIMQRHLQGNCINGVRDLDPRPFFTLTIFEKFAKKTLVKDWQIKDIFSLVGMSSKDVEVKYAANCSNYNYTHIIDVSKESCSDE